MQWTNTIQRQKGIARRPLAKSRHLETNRGHLIQLLGTSKNPFIRPPAADQARLVGMKARGGR